VSKDKIKVIGPWLAWGDDVRRGQMVRPDGSEVPVLLRGHPETSDAAQLRKDGRTLSAVEHPRILRLLHITKASGRPLWVYEGFEAASLDRVLQVLGAQGEFLPIRTCLQVVTAAAEGLEAGIESARSADGLTGPMPEIFHPGAGPTEVLVDGQGQVKVAGFRVRRSGDAGEPGPIGYVAPVDGSPEANAVFALGALLVHLLAGEAPAAGSPDPERHRSIIRRALIRVLSRPGEAVSDPVIDLIRECLCVEAAERPGLTRLQELLAARAEEAGDAGLDGWAPVKISPILQQQEGGFPSEEETRQRRYVDATSLNSDEPSSEIPPIRRPPREVPTILAKPGEGLSLAVGRVGQAEAATMTGETEPARLARDVMPSLDQSISLPMPDSLLSASGVTGMGPATAGPSLAGGVSVDLQSDEWGPLDSPTQARQTSGWIMVGGVLAGMVIASLVAWVVVDRLAGPLLGAVDSPGTSGQVEAMQAGTAADAMADEMPPPAAPAEAPAQAGVEQLPPDPAAALPPEAPAAPPASPPRAPPEVIPPPPDVQTIPRPERKPEPPPVSENGRFLVTFRSADPSVTRLEVRCHVGSGSGTTQVRIAEAGPGPCKVTGYRGDDQRKLIVSAVLTGSRSFTCFAGGRRTCE
jgi:hypothetical protein